MDLNRNSWHYQLIGSRWDHKPKSLCAYFWKIVFSIAVDVVVIPLVFVSGMGIVAIAFYPILQIWFGVSGPMAFLSAILWLFIAEISFLNFGNEGKEYYMPRPASGSKISLLASYLRAKKEKVCPLLKYVDE